MIELPERKKLWSLSPKEFNDWRRNNDLPQLFEFFEHRLPDFIKWVSHYFPNVEYLIKHDFPGRLIFGEKKMHIVSYVQENREQITCVLNHNERTYNNLRNREIKIMEDRPYIPYIQWARRKYQGRPFILADERNKSYSDNIEFRSWSAPLEHPERNTAFLFYEHPVLSLGNINLAPGVIFNSRNLDFTNLDFLKSTGSGHGNTWCHISYTSCRNIVIKDAQYAFIAFHNCPVHELEVVNSRLQDIEFEFCDLIRPEIRDSYFNGLRIRESTFTQPDISNTEIREFKYEPQQDKTTHCSFDTMRRLRNAFQRMGRRSEARKYYFLERVYERKAYWMPFSLVRGEFPSVPHRGSLIELFGHWSRTHPSARWHIFRQILLFRVTMYFRPKYAFRLMRYRLQYLLFLVESFLWGYGERPFRPIRNAIVIIILYSAIYYFSNHPQLHHSVVNALYFSIVTFTTLGFGDINPGSSNVLKSVCASEALFGAITMGFLVAGLANRSRY